MRASERPWTVAALVAIACGAVYVATLHPSLTGGDAGELIAVAAQLEVAHPPGYPVYTVLAKLATLVPIGSVAWRVNVLSALCDAAAAGVIAATVVAASGSAAAGVLAGGMFALSPVVWTYAIGAEVFALNNLLAATLFYFAYRRSALGVAVVTGLGLAHHQTLVFYLVPVVAWVLWIGSPASLAPRRLGVLASTVAAGCASYLYLPLAARHATTLSWGDPTTLRGFAAHLLRRDYGTFQLIADADPGASRYLERLAAWSAHTVHATLIVGLGLAGLAAIAALRGRGHDRAWTRLLLASLALYVLGFSALANAPVSDPLYRAVLARFWQQSDVVVFLLAGMGFALVADRRRVAALAAAVLVVAQLVLGFAAHDRHDETVAHYGRALLEPLPPATLLLTRGDLVTNATRYLQTCEGVRPDVVILDQELLTKPWYVRRAAAEHPTLRFPGVRYDPTRADGFSMRTFLDANGATQPIAVYPDWKSGDASLDGVYELWPMGLALQVRAVATPPALDLWQRESTAALGVLDDYGWPPLEHATPGTWERVVLEDVWEAHHRVGWRLLTLALARDNDPQLLEAARAELERAAHTRTDPPWFLHRNLGLLYERLALRDPARRRDQLAAWHRYLATAPPNDDARPAITATVARLERELGAP